MERLEIRAQRYLKIAHQQPTALAHQAAGYAFFERGALMDAFTEFKQATALDPSEFLELRVCGSCSNRCESTSGGTALHQNGHAARTPTSGPVSVLSGFG